MRFGISVAAFLIVVVATPASAQRLESAAVAPSLITFADATRPSTPLPAPQSGTGGGVSGGRILAIVIGAVVGGGLVYFAVSSMDCKDCDGSAATYGAIGGAAVGGFIGSAVYSFRQRRAVTPPSNIRP